jgi:hypothetical protein
LGGAVFGAAIGSMHFTGMAALTAPATFSWDPVYVAASLIIGAAGGAMALRVFMRAPGWRGVLNGTSLMCVAIAGLHFTAMSALTLTPDPVVMPPESMVMPPEWLAIALAAVMGLIVVLGLVAAIIDHKLANRAIEETARLRAHVVELEATKREFRRRRNLTQALDAAAAASQANPVLATMSHGCARRSRHHRLLRAAEGRIVRSDGDARYKGLCQRRARGGSTAVAGQRRGLLQDRCRP